jgi:hypothetical protein
MLTDAEMLQELRMCSSLARSATSTQTFDCC